MNIYNVRVGDYMIPKKDAYGIFTEGERYKVVKVERVFNTIYINTETDAHGMFEHNFYFDTDKTDNFEFINLREERLLKIKEIFYAENR